MVVNQQYDSARTSVNSKKLPAIFNKIDFDAISLHGNIPILVVDYGCGKYYDFTWKKLQKKFQDKIYFSYFPADPNFQPVNFYYLEDEVKTWKRRFPAGDVVVVCSNVLNVIKEDNIIQQIKKRLFDITPFVFFSVYEGDRSGIGRETKQGCWQRNEKLIVYQDTSHFESIRHGVLTRGCLEYIL